ncbi:E3 ubiquitin-protein ligase [Wickerhamomyces ciferrii]|uniref:E3 ubiquitin-protein ligase n=1 Tax=Wickerhamomyces ciferrii (strain ATCC 14091 / BCRC 22168 / CBS 111 / JCM 3599 / NBRC 0793 / NRRL Y-1031 F-60-10) TaxID=1206466 RepID=K0KRX9_WICCF|nr:E3 ubiquitin-protein ligase [Wickerhamomyces ciferrii]CCH45901.1 E3 ubiquitin-protein ligase [Wickerhamomyces ciferrii]
MKFFNSSRLLWFTISLYLLFQISSTLPVPQAEISGLTNQIKHLDELSIDHQNTKIEDINRSNTLEAHDDDDDDAYKHYSLISRSDIEKAENNKEANNSENDHKKNFNNLHLIWIVPLCLVGVIILLAAFISNCESTGDNPRDQGFTQHANYQKRCKNMIQNGFIIFGTACLIFLLIAGTYELLSNNEHPVIQEPATELPVSNKRNPNSSVVTRSQIDSHVYDQKKLEEVSKSSIIAPYGTYKLITIEQLETPDYEELKNKDVCLICLESYNEGRDHLAQLPCSHTLHYLCFIKSSRINGDSNNVLGSPNMRCYVCQLSLIKYHQYLADYKLDHKQVEFVNK